MSLPKLSVPLYEVICPSGLKVSFRPFLTKEEKLLLIAMESNDAETIMGAAKQILDNCIGKVSNIDIDKLPLFDIEFLFLQLRARSIGEQQTLRYKCNQTVTTSNVLSGTITTEICGTVSEYLINLLDIKPKFGADHNKYVQLTDTIGVTLRYPTFKAFRTVVRKELPPDEAFRFLVSCIESINDKESVVMTKDVKEEEVIEFVNDLNHKQIKQIDDFFDTMPKIEMDLQFKCPKCFYEEKITVKGLDSFFVSS